MRKVITSNEEALRQIKRTKIRIHATTLLRTLLYAAVVAMWMPLALSIEKGFALRFLAAFFCVLYVAIFALMLKHWARPRLDALDTLERLTKRQGDQIDNTWLKNVDDALRNI